MLIHHGGTSDRKIQDMLSFNLTSHLYDMAGMLQISLGPDNEAACIHRRSENRPDPCLAEEPRYPGRVPNS